MQRSRRNSIFTKPTGTLTCGGYESTLLTISPKPRRFRTADHADSTNSNTATIVEYVSYDGYAIAGRTAIAANTRYDNRDGTIETIERSEGQPINTAYDSLTRGSNSSMATLRNSADESTAEYCRRLPQEFSQTFTYDPLNRLNASTLGGVANQSWNLDSQGNWSSVTGNCLPLRDTGGQVQEESIRTSVSRPGFFPAQAFMRSVLIVSKSGRFC